MLETERLNVLFSLLDEMTQSKISDPELAPPVFMQRMGKYSLRGFLFATVVFLGLVAWQLLGVFPPRFSVAPHAVYFILYVLGFVYITTVTASVFHIMWRHRKQPYTPMWIALKNDLHRDVKWITQLWTLDKATLVYGLLQYRHHWSSLEGRAAILAGDLRKLGLFPAGTALFISAVTLFKGDSDPYFWSPVILAGTFYLVTCYAFLSRERPQQVIQLLEYAIQYAKMKHWKKALSEDELSKYGNPQKILYTYLVVCVAVQSTATANYRRRDYGTTITWMRRDYGGGFLSN